MIDLRGTRQGRRPRAHRVRPNIDNASAAALARHLLPIFGHLADRKLSEGSSSPPRLRSRAVAHPDDVLATGSGQEPLPARASRGDSPRACGAWPG